MMTTALVTGLIGIVLNLVSREAIFSMLALSNQYAAATSEAQKAVLTAAGQTLLTIYNGTAFNISYVLGGIVFLLFSLAMLRNNVFSKLTAYIGIGTGIIMLVPPTIGTIGIIIALISLVPTIVWLILVARTLFKLYRTIPA